MDKSLQNKKILVGVTGGIAAYKTATLVNMFLKAGADVRVVMTEAATKFITPLTFQTLTNHAVYVDQWQTVDPNLVEHIFLARWPDAIVITPATANTISKIAHGLADNLLTTIVLATPEKTPVIIAPAMNTEMWNNKTTQENLKKIDTEKKYSLVSPRSGLLACRIEGPGKIAEAEKIIEATLDRLKK